MHYTGMFAATFVHDVAEQIETANLLVTNGLTIAVISTTLLILGIALGSSIGERWVDEKTQLAEDIVSTSEEKFRLLVEAVADYAILILDHEGRVTSWNSGAERITGYTDRDIVGQHVSMLYEEKTGGPDITAQELQAAQAFGGFKGEA